MLWHLEQEIKINIQHTNHKTGVFPSILLVPGKCHISSSDKFLCFYKLLQSWKFPWFLENFSLSDSLQFLLLQKIEFKSVKKTGNFLLPSFYPAIIWRRTHLYMKMSIKVIHWFLEEESSDPGPWMHTNTCGTSQLFQWGNPTESSPWSWCWQWGGMQSPCWQSRDVCQASPRTHCWQGQLWLQLKWQLLSLCLEVQRGIRLRHSSQMLIHTQGSTNS